MTDLEKIRQSCELFSAVYPLSPEIWLRWLKTESTIASSEAEIDRVYLLFQRALADYFSNKRYNTKFIKFPVHF
jgi:squamous cell carcinoma antigen recognized by T-cells 3